jgi:hypothetical protein|uniref:Uncharacterized protein n=1 Tax=Siphoviridae sp. ctr4Z12 TaxID=2827280 RepID=A0A8S5R641_9CAUD|nr:MAG TPA: hypothetical protein [Siphoviridae sp. ctr4Z12]
MLERNEKNDELVLQYRELLKKAKEAKNADDKMRYKKEAEEKHDEMIIAEFGDRNFKRFNH